MAQGAMQLLGWVIVVLVLGEGQGSSGLVRVGRGQS